MSEAALHPGARGPLYLAVAAALRQRIVTGRWTAGERISSLAELEAEFDVSRITARQAVEVLRQEGLIDRVQGRGTYVARRLRQREGFQLNARWRPLIDAIRANVPHFLEVTENVSPPTIPFGLAAPAPAYARLCSVQSRDDRPFALADMHVAQPLFEREREGFLSRVALDVLDRARHFRPSRARQRFRIGVADVEVAQALAVPIGVPTADAELCIADADGIAALVGRITYRGDTVHVDMDLLG